MNTSIRTSLAISMLWAFTATASAGERKQTDVECKPTEEKLIYDCVFAVKGKKSGAPLPDAEFTVGADMPSMPGAHNVKPTTAEPTGNSGEYRARLHLEMTGEWALKLDFTKPNRDRVIKKYHFGGAMKEMDHSGHKMDHSGHKETGAMKKSETATHKGHDHK